MLNTTILVIEDDRDVRTCFRTLLEMRGFQVETAVNGRAGLRRLLDPPRPDIIILDLMMPEVDGWHFRRRQLDMEGVADIPVIVVSGLSKTEVDTDELKPKNFLRKPVAPRKLLGAVSEELDSQRPS